MGIGVKHICTLAQFNRFLIALNGFIYICFLYIHSVKAILRNRLIQFFLFQIGLSLFLN